jgi:hypothetical protein
MGVYRKLLVGDVQFSLGTAETFLSSDLRLPSQLHNTPVTYSTQLNTVYKHDRSFHS